MKIIKTMNADTLTPVLLFKRLSGENKSLLEGAAKDTEAGRYSLIAINPVHEIQIFGNHFYFDNRLEYVNDSLAKIYELTYSGEGEKQLPFEAGAIGYVGFDAVRQYEDIGKIPPDDRNLPDCHFFLYETFIYIDHQDDVLTIVADNCYSKRTKAEMERVVTQIALEIITPQKDEESLAEFKKLTFHASYNKEQFIELIKKAKQHILAGDIFQVVLSQRLEAKFTADPFAYYRKLRKLNPAPYLYYIDFGETKLIGSSPESLVKIDGRNVTTNPIAGTRKRGNSKEKDLELERELLADPKELAEHRMLVDLGRNDIGRISQIGSVEVPVFLTIERYRFVMHIVSVVKGILKPNLTAMDALRAVLPAGTVSGAPKIRAMQLLSEWENVKRGPYAGGVGYVNKVGNADFALAIRTMVIHREKAYVQAGAGIVHHSNPEKEYQETLMKAKALLEVGE